MRSLASKLLLSILGVLAVLVTAEFVVRATGFGLGGRSLRALHELRLDRPWLFGLRPGARVALANTGDVVYEVNADGFRDRRYPKTPAPGTYRIIILGNSVAFGYGVEQDETFPKRLEALLNRRWPARHFEVLNFAVSGYNAYNQEALLADRGVAYHPDLVVTQFSVGGLHDPTLHFDTQTQMHLGLIPLEAFPDPAKRRTPPRFPGLVRACYALRTCALLDGAVFKPIRNWFDPLPNFYSTLTREIPPGPERRWLRARFRGMEHLARSVDAGFAVLVFPYQAQVYGGASARLQEQLTALGREEGWVMIDLLPEFLRAAKTDPPLFLDPWHVTPLGNELTAEIMADALDRRGLLSRGAAAARPDPGLS